MSTLFSIFLQQLLSLDEIGKIGLGAYFEHKIVKNLELLKEKGSDFASYLNL